MGPPNGVHRFEDSQCVQTAAYIAMVFPLLGPALRGRFRASVVPKFRMDGRQHGFKLPGASGSGVHSGGWFAPIVTRLSSEAVEGLVGEWKPP